MRRLTYFIGVSIDGRIAGPHDETDFFPLSDAYGAWLGEEFVRAVYERYTGPGDSGFLDRAWTYQRWVGVYMLTDHFEVGKTTWSVARATFDRCRAPLD